jgi:hypothetical protein
LEESAEREDFLHFCEVALMIMKLGQIEISDDLRENLRIAENCVDSGNLEFSVDELLISLQKSTPITIHLAVSQHLLRSAAIRSGSLEIGAFANLVHCLIHPILLSNRREECEQFVLLLKSELKKGKEANFVVFERELRNFVSICTDSKLKLKPREIERQKSEEFIDEREWCKLRRRMNDLEGVLDQFVKYNKVLIDVEKSLKSRIEGVERELDLYESFPSPEKR